MNDSVLLRIQRVRHRSAKATVFSGLAIDEEGRLVAGAPRYAVTLPSSLAVAEVAQGQWWYLASSQALNMLCQHTLAATSERLLFWSDERERREDTVCGWASQCSAPGTSTTGGSKTAALGASIPSRKHRNRSLVLTANLRDWL
jgi:hypothetical protein